MRIVMLGPFGLHPKGTMRARALPAARMLAARGHTVDVVMPPWHTPDEAGRAWRDEPSGVGVRYVSLRAARATGVGHALVARRLANAATELAPDVVHLFKPKAYSGLAGVLLRGRQRLGRRFRLVVDTDDWEGRGGWNELEPYPRAMRAFFAWQERWGLTHADAVTVASRALETLAWSLGVKAARVTYLPNALEAAEGAVLRSADGALPPSDRAAPGHGPVLLLYTRFFEFDLARPLEVLARVRGDHPAARLVVAGCGLFGEEAAFGDLARRMGLGDAVEMRGWVEPDAAGALFASADVALYPFDDTLVNRAKSPVKLLELLAAGVPVVGEAVGELAEAIEDGHSGRLVRPGDVDAFAAAVGSLLDEPAARLAMGEAARARVRAAFRWDVRVVDLEAAYLAAAAGVSA